MSDLVSLANSAINTFTKGKFGSYQQRLHSLDLQNPNLWEFNFEDNPSLKFHIYEISVPFKSIEHERHASGYKYFKSYNNEDDITIAFRETTEFTVLQYLKEWFNEIFDETERVFKTGNKGRNATLSFQTHNFIQQLASQFTVAASFINKFEKNTIKFEFQNMRVVEIEDYSLNYENTSHLSTNATFICDTVVMDTNSIESKFNLLQF